MRGARDVPSGKNVQNAPSVNGAEGAECEELC